MFIASRTKAKVDAAIEQLEMDVPSSKGKIEFVELDLKRLESARQCAEQFKSRSDRLDGLVLNAGVMNIPYALTEVYSSCSLACSL